MKVSGDERCLALVTETRLGSAILTLELDLVLISRRRANLLHNVRLAVCICTATNPSTPITPAAHSGPQCVDSIYLEITPASRPPLADSLNGPAQLPAPSRAKDRRELFLPSASLHDPQLLRHRCIRTCTYH